MDGPANALISVGIPANSAHFVAALLASTIASWALTHVPTVTGRHLFSTATGLLLSFYAYGWATGYLLASCAGSYAVLLTTRRYCGPITAVGTITYLIYWCGEDSCLRAKPLCNVPLTPRRRPTATSSPGAPSGGNRASYPSQARPRNPYRAVRPANTPSPGSRP